MLLKPFDRRLSSSLLRALLPVVCLLETFVAAQPPMQKVAPPAGNTPIDDALRLHIYSTETERVPCLEFTVLSPSVYYCSSHGLSKLVHKESIELGQVRFQSLQSRKTVTDELSRTLTGSTSGASWRDMDDSMDNLANSHIFVDTPGTMGIWEQVIVRETFTELKVFEHRFVNANNKKSIELLLLIGHTGLKFTAPESTMPVHVQPQIMMLFSHHVNFRNPAAVNKAIQYISGLKITDVPYWLKEVLINEGLDKMPNCGLPWNQIDKAIGILPEIESGFIYHRVDVTTTASLADWRENVRVKGLKEDVQAEIKATGAAAAEPARAIEGVRAAENWERKSGPSH
ncbi:hypothetical protein C8R42DRAFT_329331 [Lentinula raphanica]|nr:hypothetical protein C8R42DRAFT_329331 [Lentinula raphanica]